MNLSKPSFCYFEMPEDVSKARLLVYANRSMEMFVYDPLGHFRGKFVSKIGTVVFPLKGPFLPGKWAVFVFVREKGAEVEVRLEVEPGSPKWRWFLGELHTHTTASDGKRSPEELAEILAERGVDFFFVTDHNAFGIPAPRWIDAGNREVLAIPGIEVTSSTGHFLALDVRGKELVAPDFFKRTFWNVKAVGIAHPTLGPMKECPDCRWRRSIFPASFMEVWNSGNEGRVPYNEDALKLWDRLLSEGKRITGVAGGDIHDVISPIWMPLKVFAPDLSPGFILLAILRGWVMAGAVERFEVLVGGVAHGPGSTVEPGKARARVKVDRECVIRLVGNGFDRKLVAKEVEIDLPESLTYLRVEARDTNGNLIGFSNPVFFGRERGKER